MIDTAFSVALAAAVFVLVVSYAGRVRRSGAFTHARVEKAAGSPLLAKSVMQMGYWALRPLGRACIAARISANAISWASLGFAAGAGLALAVGAFGIGAALGAASAICDALDGLVARETGTASESGEVLDATIDRYAELLFLGGIAYHERLEPVPIVLALGAMAGSVMVSYSTAKAEALRVEAPRGLMRRQERAVYLILGTALVPFFALVGVRHGAPPWFARVPLYAALILLSVLGNFSAVKRLRAVAAAVRLPEHRHAPQACAATLPRDAHAAAGDAFH